MCSIIYYFLYLNILHYLIFNYVCMFVSQCRCVHVSASAGGSQKRAFGSCSYIQKVVSSVLGAKLRSSARAVRGLTAEPSLQPFRSYFLRDSFSPPFIERLLEKRI